MTEPNTVDLAAVRDHIAALKTVEAQLRALNETKASLQNDIKAALGDNEVGTVDNQVAVTWKRNAKTRFFNKSALAKDHPALVDEYTELREGNRPFKLADDE